MITNKLSQQMIGLTLALLLLTACGGASTETVIEATPIPMTVMPSPPTATAVTLASVPAPSGLQPLSSDECAGLADTVSQTLGVSGETTEATFDDFVNQRTGTGCELTFTGTGLDFGDLQDLENALRRVIQVQGWFEDFRYAGAGPTGYLTGLRQANKLCRLLVEWKPSEDADCPSDQPIGMCELLPEQKLYTIRLNCVQDTTAAITPLDIEPQRIQFAPDAVSAQVESSLAVGGAERYVLTAMAGQEMTLNLSVTSAVDSEEMKATLAVWGADGTRLVSGDADFIDRVGELPSTQDYYIDVMSVAQAPFEYTLEVIIPPPASQPEPEPTRIQFAPGAISAQVQGSLVAGGAERYVLTVTAGQEMTVNLSDSSAAVGAILIIWGADGTVLISDHADATSWVGEIPFTQDYIISVRSVAQAPVDYALEVIIPPAVSQPEPEPTRIQFAPGAISAQVQGSLVAGGADRYVLTATAGQEMTVHLSDSSAVVSAILIIWGADGTVLISDHADATSWVGEIPFTQDYTISVRSVAQAPVDYALEVIIPPAGSQPEPEPTRIQFAPGAISAQVQGSLAAGGVERYVLTVTSGQEMTVNLSDSSATVGAILVIWGADGTVLISDHADATNWVGEIPFTQDYTISVRSVAQAPVDYALEVIIP